MRMKLDVGLLLLSVEQKCHLDYYAGLFVIWGEQGRQLKLDVGLLLISVQQRGQLNQDSGQLEILFDQKIVSLK